MLNMDIAVAGDVCCRARVLFGGAGGVTCSLSLTLFLTFSLSILLKRDWVCYVGHMRI
jgi:hypothetical protein